MIGPLQALFGLEYHSKLLIRDDGLLPAGWDFSAMLREAGFRLVRYEADESFRAEYERSIRDSAEKTAILVSGERYIPYDIRSAFYPVNLSLSALMPRLNPAMLRRYLPDLELICFSRDELYEDLSAEPARSRRFIEERAFSQVRVKAFAEAKLRELAEKIENSPLSAAQWVTLAKEKARLELILARAGLHMDTRPLDEAFASFILSAYGSLSQTPDGAFPWMLPKALDYICQRTPAGQKTALLLVDGMSLTDWYTAAQSFSGIRRREEVTFAMIPTTTAISRQALFSGKFPQELTDPFSLKNESRQFFDALTERGYKKHEILFSRGMAPELTPVTRFAGIILNDIDDIVHGQLQSRIGMYNDVDLYARSGKLQNLIRQLWRRGFHVWLTSDHGNTPAVGMGKLKNIGVETETRSSRMVVRESFAPPEEDGRLIRYPGYYLDKHYSYYICESGSALETADSEVVAHGGMSIDEVIVPFIEITGVENAE